MANERITFTTPVGRYITGDHTSKRTKDFENRPIPENKQSFEVGLAILKTDPLLYDDQAAGRTGLIHDLYRYAAMHYQQNAMVSQRIQQFPRGTKHGGFSWKIKDGDVPDDQGQKMEHAEGCYVFFFSSTFPIKVCDTHNREIDPKELKRGYYIRIAGSATVNGEVGDRAGIYLNPNIIQLCGFGPEIFGGLSPEQAFGNAPAIQLPPGASQIPVAPSGGMPGLPGQQPAVMGQPQPGFPGGAPSSMMPSHSNGGAPVNPQTGQPVQPHTGILMPSLPGMPGR